MPEIDRIVDQVQRAAGGDAWFGSSVRAALEGVNANVASGRPIPGAHSIGEIVLHLTAWTREVTRRLRLGVAENPEDGDWPVLSVGTDADWAVVVAAFDEANAELVAAIGGLEDAHLDERIGDERDRALGSGVSVYVTLHGLAQHHAYHAGQIMLLKRAAGSAV
jgi:uncharacterized damage-inducible protein DinB